MYVGVTANGYVYRVRDVSGIKAAPAPQAGLKIEWNGLNYSCPKCGTEGAHCDDECGYVHCPCGHDFIPVHVRRVTYREG